MDGIGSGLYIALYAACTPNSRKMIAPAMVRCRTSMRDAKKAPAVTAMRMHTMCARLVPMATILMRCVDARIMVVIWLRSPHSPKNDRVSACENAGVNSRPHKLRKPSQTYR